MDDKHQHVQNALPAYALNALEESEHATVAQHLEHCSDCRTHFVEVQSVLDVLPYALPPHTPAPEMKGRLLAAAAREKRPSPLPAAPPRAATPWQSLFAALRPFRWATVALVLIVLVGWNVYLQQQLTEQPATTAPFNPANVPAGAIIPLTGTGHAGATARLYLEEDHQSGVLAVHGLPPLPPGRVYQLWFAPADSPAQSGAVFPAPEQGVAFVDITVPLPLETVEAIAITEEAAPHSDRPTGEHLLDGEVRQE